MRSKTLKPLWIALAGVFLIIAEMAWSGYQDYRAARVFPGFQMHVYPGTLALRSGELGLLLCFVAFIWASIRGGWSIFSRRRNKMSL